MKATIAYGTRPEEIKLMPVVLALEERGVDVSIWNSGQSQDLTSVTFVGNYWPNLRSGMASLLCYGGLLKDSDVALVEGDTATAFAVALNAFLRGVPVAHVEAGLRTYTDEPYPEEAFRRMIAPLARWHFAPDLDAGNNLIHEGVPEERIFVVGNPVIDTLPQKPMRVLVTLHRRENWGERIQNALDCIRTISLQERDIIFDIIKHPNWQTQDLELPHEHDRLGFIDPLPREELLELLQHSDLVVTDSGGLQEEAAHFGIPCIVYRTSTERTALLERGAVELCNPDDWQLYESILAHWYRRRCYGDGDAAEKIADILVNDLD